MKETWIVLAKPGMEVIGTFELEKGGRVNIDIDTRDLCVKAFEITEPVPADLVKAIETRTDQTSFDGKLVPVVTISISKAKIKAGFAKQKYRFSLTNKKFEAKQAMEIP